MVVGKRSTWSLSLGGGFELTSPKGESIKLPYRKVQHLLAMLAVAPGRCLKRDDIGMALWPNASIEARKVSTRQAIYKLRAILGDEIVEVDGPFCRLSPLLQVPDGAEFELYRRAEEHDSEDIHKPVTAVVDSFVEVLKWFADRDSAQMLELMRDNLDIAAGISPPDLRTLVDKVTPNLEANRRLPGWTSFWRGCERVIADDICQARAELKLAVDLGSSANDKVLQVEALFWLSSCEILLRRLDAANRLAERAEREVASSSSRHLRARAQTLRSLVLIHQGRGREGLNLLAETSGSYEHRLLDFAFNESLRAFFHACAGETKTADELLELPNRVASESRHNRLESICGLAKGYVALWEGDRGMALNSFDRLVAKSAQENQRHFEIYSREARAVTLLQMGEKPDAVREMTSSRKLRNSLKMAYTDWDIMRIKSPMKRQARCFAS